MWLLLIGQVFQTWYQTCVTFQHKFNSLCGLNDTWLDHETYTLYAEKYFVHCN